VTDPSKKHEYIRWNPELSQWFCIQCGRTSDHQALPDARVELEQFECKLPSVSPRLCADEFPETVE